MKKTLMWIALAMVPAWSPVQADPAPTDGQSYLALTVPSIDVAEYHRPYVAVWLRNQDSGEIHNISVWYQLGRGGPAGKGGDDKGEQWLKDMRQWWRYSGRRLDMPVDGISGATRQPGDYQLALQSTLSTLAPGQYVLNVEAAREVGGREMLKIPFVLPVSKAAVLTAKGESELGEVALHLVP